MLDALTLIYEELFALLGRQVRIESSRYPDAPAEGVLSWVGFDPYAGISAWVQVSGRHVTRYIPLAHVSYYGAVDG